MAGTLCRRERPLPLSHPDLRRRLQAMPIGPDEAALDFETQLARENGWSRAFAGHVITEYRRFLYLCCVARDPVTPSDEVDQTDRPPPASAGSTSGSSGARFG